MTLNELVRILSPLAAMFNRAITPDVATMYLAALQGVSAPDLERAVARAIRTEKFFPVAATLRELSGAQDALPVANRALTAWAEVCKTSGYVSVDVEDPALAATIESMGGWVELHDDERETQWVQKDFLRWYEHWAIQNLPAGVKAFAGREERANVDIHWARPAPRVRLGAPKLKALEGGKPSPKKLTDGADE